MSQNNLERMDEYKASAVVQTFVAFLLAHDVDPEVVKEAWYSAIHNRIDRSDEVRTLRGLVRMAETSPTVQDILR